MKARPIKFRPGSGSTPCTPAEATHLKLWLPGPTGLIILPVNATPHAWQWNQSTEAPTLTPSLLTDGTRETKPFRCHCFITDGKARFLSDCSHEFTNQEVPLLEAQ